ncbi:MAG: branched-chain amino acid ABC transporter permease [Candidatus Tectomicrobia bacterium]|nr:branched-chain amino acid ABC transporter permease [Candidatus Tectomicrobia bacterium]
MKISLLIQAAINGLLLGGVYSLVAVGLSLIFGVMRVINFAHGEMMVWGMYIAYWWFVLTGWNPYFSLLVSPPLVFLMGYTVQRLLVNRILDVPEEMQVLLLLGVALVLQNSALLFWGPDFRTIQTPYSLSTIWLGEFVIDVPRIVAFGLAILLTLLLSLFLTTTELGRSIRASADNREGAMLVGINVEKIYAVSFGVGAACVGAAGALIVPFLPVSPHVSLPFTLTAFVVVILGGMGSLFGAFIGGLIVGVGESLGAVLLSSSFKQIVSFTLLILIMLFRPQGLFGGRG